MKPIVNAETNLGKKTRTPKDYNAIEKGALNLSLQDRVNLRNNLSISVEAELKDMEEKYNAAKAMLAGKN